MIQLINVTEEKLTDSILEGVRKELEQFKKQFQPKQPTEWVSRNDVAKMLGVSFTTLYSWNSKKILVAYSIGNRVYYKLDEVNNALTKSAC
ncbi:helix-turn-helix domain-containing protein [Polaribacter sp. OB-PA-B3]